MFQCGVGFLEHSLVARGSLPVWGGFFGTFFSREGECSSVGWVF